MTNSFLLIEISQPYVPKYIIISFTSSQFFFLPHPSHCSSFHATLPHLFSVYRHLFFEGFSSSIHSRLCHIGSTWKMRTLVFWVGKLSRHHVRRSILSTQLWSQKSHPFGFRKYQFSLKTNPLLNWNVIVKLFLKNIGRGKLKWRTNLETTTVANEIQKIT